MSKISFDIFYDFKWLLFSNIVLTGFAIFAASNHHFTVTVLILILIKLTTIQDLLIKRFITEK